MTIVHGHPTGNPNSFHAALAHWERGRLAAFCVPWIPRPWELRVLRNVPRLRRLVERLERRSFAPLLDAPRIEGRAAEWRRMIRRLTHRGQDPLADSGNQWLMRTLVRACARPGVSAVHSYEDCSLGAFIEARRHGLACIYDMPIGYYEAWQDTQRALMQRYADWLPAGQPQEKNHPWLERKRRELALADVVLAPTQFVKRTIQRFSDQPVAIATYGANVPSTAAADPPAESYDTLQFLAVGHVSIRKGSPLLFDAWARANLPNAQLKLAGTWHLAPAARQRLPSGVEYLGHLSPQELRRRYEAAHVLVAPSFFEGFPVVIGEALAAGLPVLASDAAADTNLVPPACGRVFPVGDADALVAALEHFSIHRGQLAEMRSAVRAQARALTWENYRSQVAAAVTPFC